MTTINTPNGPASEAIFTVTSADASELQRQAEQLRAILPHVSIIGPETNGEHYVLGVPLAELADVGPATTFFLGVIREWFAGLPPEQQEVQISIRRVADPAAPWHIGVALPEPDARPDPELSAQDRAYLDRAFPGYTVERREMHPGSGVQLLARMLAEGILRACPGGRERSVALTNLETALMWALASIAREQPVE